MKDLMMKLLQPIEVEIRGLLTEAEYRGLTRHLKDSSVNISVNDRETVFFIIPGKTLKVSNYLHKNKAKIALKVGDIVKDKSQIEYELFFTPDQYETAISLFKNLGFTEIQYTSQKRTDYDYDFCTISVKWSEDWGYHYEIDTVITDESEVYSTRQYLLDVANRLGLKVMDENEFGRRCAEIDRKHRSQQ